VEKSSSLTNKVYKATLTGQFAKDFGLKEQIRPAAVSILSNIAEGFERGGDKEFIQFLAAAKDSAGELRAQLYIALDQQYVSQESFEQLSTEVTQVSQLISGFMRYLKESDLRGSKLR
jgi:four helix bundle protein